MSRALEHSAAERHVGATTDLFLENASRLIPSVVSSLESPVVPTQWPSSCADPIGHGGHVAPNLQIC